MVLSDITSISSAMQMIQSRTQNAISIQVIKQAAQSEQAVADMLANLAKASAGSEQGRINITV
jgi:glutamate/tyrosine decarboxylase-like PLP-dependent enzyme